MGAPDQPTCGALKPPLRICGWTCNGTNLVVPGFNDGPLSACGIPVVIRADLLPAVDPITREMVEQHGTQPFPGGDHYHLVLEES